MKKIKSYTSIWSVEKVIYAINDFQLPFPLTFTQMAWFVVSLFVVILFGELPPFNMIDGVFLKYVYCKIELPKVANGNWRMLHLQIGESCKAFARSAQERCSA